MDNEKGHLFPGETWVDAFVEKGVRFEVIKKEATIWCGTLGYADDLDKEPDPGPLLEKYQSLVEVEKRGRVSPDWSGCLSLNYWPGGKKPRGLMFMQQVDTTEQDARNDVFQSQEGLYIRIGYDSADVPQKLFGKEQCDVFELFGPIHEAALQNGYEPIPTGDVEIEYYGPQCRYAYCEVRRCKTEKAPA